jgi:DNA-directed RNA polymerase specialized sigma24 family protein
MVNATTQATTGQQDGRAVLLQLLAEVARGNKSAFARLYGLTHAKLLGVALRILRDRALAEDVLQESYLKVWRHASSYDPAIASPMTWMATIVRHGAIDALRKTADRGVRQARTRYRPCPRTIPIRSTRCISRGCARRRWRRLRGCPKTSAA